MLHFSVIMPISARWPSSVDFMLNYASHRELCRSTHGIGNYAGRLSLLIRREEKRRGTRRDERNRGYWQKVSRLPAWGGEAWVREILTREGAKSEDP